MWFAHGMQQRRSSKLSSIRSLGDVLGLSAGASVGTSLPLVVGVNLDDSFVILVALLSSASDALMFSFCFSNLGSLVSDLTITGHGAVFLAHFLSFTI